VTAVTAAAADEEEEAVATDPQKAPAYMAQAVLGFNEQLERIGEVLVVTLLGAMLTRQAFTWQTLLFIALLLFVPRPLAVICGLIGAALSRPQRRLIAWFGIRGIGSVYYLTYAIEHGLPEDLARTLSGIVLATVAVSAVVHGISVTPLMRSYRKRSRSRSLSDERLTPPASRPAA
jgi:NhaP-type Na+/H+ or K+/H+ antiporter